MASELVLAAEGVALLALLLASAFFSMSETALISANRLRIRALREQGDARARALDALLRDPETLITTVLVGNNTVNIAASVLSAVVAVELLGDVGAAVAAGAMVFVVLVFAEIAPKTLAVRHPTAIALRIAGPMALLVRVLAPAVWLFRTIASGVLRLAGVRRPGKAPFITEEEIKLLLRVGEEQGTIERFERKVISEVFDFTETKAHRVMTTRDRIAYVARSATMSEALDAVVRTGFSRLLVVEEESLDRVVGFVHAKDLLRFTDPELRVGTVAGIVRPVVVAPANLETHELLVLMQRARTHVAVVKDSTGATVGLLTLEDLVEELVGEIHDEFDEAPPAPRTPAPGEPAPSERKA